MGAYCPAASYHLASLQAYFEQRLKGGVRAAAAAKVGAKGGGDARAAAAASTSAAAAAASAAAAAAAEPAGAVSLPPGMVVTAVRRMADDVVHVACRGILVEGADDGGEGADRCAPASAFGAAAASPARSSPSSSTDESSAPSSSDASPAPPNLPPVPYDGHAFFFQSGAAVLWGIPAPHRRQLLGAAARFSTEPAASPAAAAAAAMRGADSWDHDFAFHTPAGRAGVRGDELYVSSWGAVPEVLALSYGLAQSVKLHVYEGTIDGLVEATRGLPVELARAGEISLPRRQVRQLIGQLLAARYSVSLVSDILDSPEFFWSHPELERLHTEAVAAVELRHRARILDARVAVIRDALEVLNAELGQSSSMRVERAILFLIFVEVMFEVYNQARRHREAMGGAIPLAATVAAPVAPAAERGESSGGGV